jgi:NADPH-dependent 7-cyano-7-deazaguanine reductase QueF
MIATVDASGDVTVRTHGDITHLCPFRDEVDRGRIDISWRVDGQTIELHSLRDYLDGYATSALSHEAITDRIRHDLSVLPGVVLLAVTTRWTTADMEVACATSPTPLAPVCVTP